MTTSLRSIDDENDTHGAPTDTIAHGDNITKAQNKSGSQGEREPLRGVAGYKLYSVGKIVCVKPTVLMVRSMGVSGGSKAGVRKLVSNW